MKMALTIIFLSFFSISYCQTQKQLVHAIIKNNSLDGYDGVENHEEYEKNGISGNNYYNFEKLKLLLSKQELLKLVNSNNLVLRLYAIRELIKQNDNRLNLKKIILYELKQNRKVQTHEGCIIDSQLTYSIIHSDCFYNKNERLYEIDSTLITFEKDIYWLIYHKIFDTRKFDKNFNGKIKKLVYDYNNSSAFNYLKKNYPEEFIDLAKDYYTNYFPQQKFDTENQVYYLFDFTKYALESGNKEYVDITLKKLKETQTWKMHRGWFEVQLFDKYKIKL